jgi:hypothetical protein
MLRSPIFAILSACAALAVCGCVPSHGNPPVPPPVALTRRDSVRAAWRLVYAYTRAVDHYARAKGELPATLEPVVARGEAGPDTDVWGRRLRYRSTGLRFEVRSAGADGTFDTNDDIVALGQVGRKEPCEIRDEFGAWRGSGYEASCTSDVSR